MRPINERPRVVILVKSGLAHSAHVRRSAASLGGAGYDVFVLGGMRDLGYSEIPDAVDIPVAFIGEATFRVASLLANRFAVIYNDEAAMQPIAELVKRYDLQGRALPGVCLHCPHGDFVARCESEPQRMLEEITAAARQAIKQGADILLTEFAAASLFLAEQGVRHIDGIPVLDSQAAVIKVAEMKVDFRRLGLPKSGRRPMHSVTAEDIHNARRIYGVE
jgi:Asp/Glu/hydantoin racemase